MLWLVHTQLLPRVRNDLAAAEAQDKEAQKRLHGVQSGDFGRERRYFGLHEQCVSSQIGVSRCGWLAAGG